MRPIDTAPPLVLITWEDACNLDTDAWADNNPVKYEPQLFQQVGFLLHECKEGVIITSAWSVDKVAPRDQIPRGMIRSVKRLKV